MGLENSAVIFAEGVRLRWDLTGPCDELGKHTRIVLGRMGVFLGPDLCFHYKVRVGRKEVDGVGSSLSSLGLLESVILQGVVCMLGFAG